MIFAANIDSLLSAAASSALDDLLFQELFTRVRRLNAWNSTNI